MEVRLLFTAAPENVAEKQDPSPRGRGKGTVTRYFVQAKCSGNSPQKSRCHEIGTDEYRNLIVKSPKLGEAIAWGLAKINGVFIMQRFYGLVAATLVSVLVSGGVLSSVLLSLTPDYPETVGGGPPELPGLLQRTVQERELIGEKREVIDQKEETVDIRLANFVNQFRTYERQLDTSVRQLESSLRMSQAPLRSAAQQFRMSVTQLNNYKETYRAQMEYAQQMAAQMAIYGGSDMTPEYDRSYLNGVYVARGEFEIAWTQYIDSLENERLRANMDLLRLQHEIVGTLNDLASLQVESLSNQTEALALYEQLIQFVNKFGRLAGTPVDLPPSVRPREFTGKTWRALLDGLMTQTRSGMSGEAVAEQYKENVRQDDVIQFALQNLDRDFQ